MPEYKTKPAQFRLPKWAHEFLAQESAERGVSKTVVIAEALECLKERHFENVMAQGYREMAEFHREEVRDWECTLMDGLEDEGW